MTNEKDDYTIYDYVSQNFGIQIGEICTCLTCHAKNQTIKIRLIYYAIGRNITERKKLRPISHGKNTHLGKSCVTMTYFMVKFYEKTELSDVICEEFSK